MNKGIMTKLVVALCACAVAGMLAACSMGPAASSASKSPEQLNRAYMSQVNESMAKLQDSLGQFTDAVSRGDVVSMRTEADNAYKVLDGLEAIEAPEDMADIREQYLKGTKAMREALDSYIELYTEASAAGGSYSWADHETRVKKVQSLYDDAVKQLKAADEAVASAAAGSASSASK